MFGLSDAILGLTFLAWGNSIGGEYNLVFFTILFPVSSVVTDSWYTSFALVGCQSAKLIIFYPEKIPQETVG